MLISRPLLHALHPLMHRASSLSFKRSSKIQELLPQDISLIDSDAVQVVWAPHESSGGVLRLNDYTECRNVPGGIITQYWAPHHRDSRE